MLFQESETVELKQDYSDSIRKEVIAFANTNGGTIYIGVDDSGKVIGVASVDQMIQRITSLIRDSVMPDVTMFVHYETVSVEGKQILRITVSRGTARPYYIVSKGMKSDGVYVRQGTTSAPATDASIRQMIQETDGDSYEKMRSLKQDLTFSYASGIFENQGLVLEDPQMKTLGILSTDDTYTNLGLLLSDQCPHIIKAAVFGGKDQTLFQDRREFTGSLLRQVDDAYAFMDLRNERTATFDGLQRTDHRAYPEAALREALLNAFIHRDYSYAASTLISAYADRIEIISVGGLVSGFTLADVMTGFSICRNPNLANVFYRLNLIEAYGTGLKKITGLYPAYTPVQLFDTTPNVFKVTLPKSAVLPQQPSSQKESPEELVLSALGKAENISRADVETLTGLSTSSAARLLRRMVELGSLEVTGNGKNIRYRFRH